MGAGLVYPDWPLFDGKLVSAGGRLADIHYAHRLLAAVAGLLVLGFGWQLLERDRRPVVMGALAVLGLLFAAQVMIGALNVWLELATSVRILHLALASAVWGVLVRGGVPLTHSSGKDRRGRITCSTRRRGRRQREWRVTYRRPCGRMCG
jgi:heme A synthase